MRLDKTILTEVYWWSKRRNLLSSVNLIELFFEHCCYNNVIKVLSYYCTLPYLNTMYNTCSSSQKYELFTLWKGQLLTICICEDISELFSWLYVTLMFDHAVHIHSTLISMTQLQCSIMKGWKSFDILITKPISYMNCCLIDFNVVHIFSPNLMIDGSLLSYVYDKQCSVHLYLNREHDFLNMICLSLLIRPL